MTQSEAEEIQRICNEVLAALRAMPQKPSGSKVNWDNLWCYDVLLSPLHPNSIPILKIEIAAPEVWAFKVLVVDKMEQRTGRRFLIETRW